MKARRAPWLNPLWARRDRKRLESELRYAHRRGAAVLHYRERQIAEELLQREGRRPPRFVFLRRLAVTARYLGRLLCRQF